ncbi:hypothetical protein [Paenibacillus sp. IHBB 10380]|uniref:hypothetical protein n=1 Tax=Paenibacillus sp. IHBB 10380 TaxID=1566358 RepID=UPI0005CFC5A7|nr:hypothetical protein [Paenibacillus sp. IHBB 10380]AJS57493.1 hypothetical protein UB51_02180 [Paenibacillus sp. IHBB 10380]
MSRRKGKDRLFLCVLIVLVAFVVYEGYRMVRPTATQEDAGKMLFEVTYFQMEVLNTSLMDALQVSYTEDLNALKLAAYSAHYSHERMVRTYGKGHLQSLSALEQLLDRITKWQIGGNRPLTDSERDLLTQYSTNFAELLPVYSLLLDHNDRIASSQADHIKQIDENLDSLLSGS